MNGHIIVLKIPSIMFCSDVFERYCTDCTLGGNCTRKLESVAATMTQASSLVLLVVALQVQLLVPI